jgi:hypothetical protein
LAGSPDTILDHSTKVWLQLAQWFLRRRFLCQFPIGSYVKLSSAVGAILIEGPDIFLEENHLMTISSKFCSYWANGFRQEDFYGNCTTLCDKVCQWLATGRWFSPGPPISSTNKTDCHDITEKYCWKWR